MNDVMQAVGVFFSYAVLAVFAQNAVFTRGLGVSRLVQLVGDERTSSGWFALLLCVTQVLVAPLAFYAGGFVAAQPNPAQLRPLVFLACVAVVSLFEFIVLWAARGKRHGGQLLRILPLAAVNSGVLGTVLVERTQSFTLEQSMGFGLGSGLGYLLAVMLVVEPLLTYRFGRVQETMKKAVSKGIRITVGYGLLLLLLGCVREWLSAGTVFGHVLSRPVLPMASMPAGGFIVLGVLCAVWRTLAKKHKNYLTSEARGLMAVYRQKEGEPEDE